METTGFFRMRCRIFGLGLAVMAAFLVVLIDRTRTASRAWGAHGVFISGAPDDTIGGTTDEAANTILRNSIFNNGNPNEPGIALGNDGVTANDPRDPTSGPNTLQNNFPVIDSASTTTIIGRLNRRPNKTFTIQFFSNPAPNFPTLFREGETFLGETSVTTSDQGIF